MTPLPRRLAPSAGIAIGPILFVIAILAVLAMAMSSGNGDYQVASSADRVSADIGAQANLIRNTFAQCNMQYVMEKSLGAIDNATELYPASDSTGTTVANVTCTPMGGTSMWSDKLLPPPTAGFAAWTYVNGGTSGGRCIFTAPTAASPSAGTLAGLVNAARKFNTATAATTTAEVVYDPTSSSHKFIVWITLPTGTANDYCKP